MISIKKISLYYIKLDRRKKPWMRDLSYSLPLTLRTMLVNVFFWVIFCIGFCSEMYTSVWTEPLPCISFIRTHEKSQVTELTQKNNHSPEVTEFKLKVDYYFLVSRRWTNWTRRKKINKIFNNDKYHKLITLLLVFSPFLKSTQSAAQSHRQPKSNRTQPKICNCWSYSPHRWSCPRRRVYVYRWSFKFRRRGWRYLFARRCWSCWFWRRWMSGLRVLQQPPSLGNLKKKPTQYSTNR